LKVDLDNIDEKEFPKMKYLEFMDCVLEEGKVEATECVRQQPETGAAEWISFFSLTG
jgi:hypothetical protein